MTVVMMGVIVALVQMDRPVVKANALLDLAHHPVIKLAAQYPIQMDVLDSVSPIVRMVPA